MKVHTHKPLYHIITGSFLIPPGATCESKTQGSETRGDRYAMVV